MTDNQKVYIRGVEGRGIDVIAALERLGGKTDRVGSLRLYAFGNIPYNVFIIGHDGQIAYTDSEGEAFEIIKDNYREIKLPENWKDGDILVDNDNPNRFAVKRNVWNDGNFKAYLVVNQKCVHELPVVTFCDKNYHKADSEEVRQFHEILHKQGKDWDAENKQLVDWKWKPTVGDKYWIITTDGVVGNLIWNDDPADNRLFNLGNCFHIREEAEAMLKKIKKLLNAKS